MDKLLLGLILLSIAVCLGVGPAHADVKDLGDVCILFSYNVGFPPVTRLYRALAYGGGQQHILLTATGQPQHGFAVLNGDQIIVTLNGTSVAPDSSTIIVSTTQIVLSTATLRGPVTTITSSLLPGPESGRLTGTASVVPCD